MAMSRQSIVPPHAGHFVKLSASSASIRLSGDGIL
jgi:hypothetical protein